MARDLMVEARERGLDPYGLSFHLGSQQRDSAQWEIAIGRTAMLFSALDEAGSASRWSISAAGSRSIAVTPCLRSTTTPEPSTGR